MTRLSLSALFAVCLFAITCAPANAQEVGGDALAQKATQLREAVLHGTPNQLFTSLAPWVRGRGSLAHEVMKLELEQMNDDGVIRDLAALDPEGKLGVRTRQDVIRLTPADLNALTAKVFVLRASEEAEPGIAARWHEVDRRVAQEFDEGGEALVRRGTVLFMNVYRHRFEVRAVAHGPEWHIVGYAYEIGDVSVDSDDTLVGMWEKVMRGRTDSVNRAMRAEAEALAGAMRNRLRLHYARTNRRPTKFVGDDVARQFELEGVYFKVEETIHELPGVKGAMVVVPKVEAATGFLLAIFEYNTGATTLKWFETRAELDEHLSGLKDPE